MFRGLIHSNKRVFVSGAVGATLLFGAIPAGVQLEQNGGQESREDTAYNNIAKHPLVVSGNSRFATFRVDPSRLLQNSVLSVSHCDAEKPKDAMPPTRQFFWPPSGQSGLNLVAEGMRRKNLYVVAVDVYKVGIYLSPAQDSAMMTAVSNGAPVNLVNRPRCRASGPDAATMGVALHFVRSVSTKQVVDATIEALTKGVDAATSAAAGESYHKALADMQQQLTQGIGPNGMKTHEEMQFTFFLAPQGQEYAAMVIKDDFVATLEHPLLVRRLAEVYGDTDPKTAIAIGVPQQLTERYKAAPQQ